MTQKLRITREALEVILRHAEEEYPLEACGLLFGELDDEIVVLKVKRMKNVAISPVEYRIDPHEMYRALVQADEEGLDLVGTYHSHTGGPPLPSRRDEDLAHPGLVYLIVSLSTHEAKAFVWNGKRFEELEVIID